MWQRLIAILILAGLLGCGQAEAPGVYDTANNPDGFPQAAVDLLVGLETGQLVGGEAITNAFGELFTHHSELLDHQGWTAVVEKLGTEFNKTADSLAANGIGSYTIAAEYYQLGSFARPDDRPLRRQAALFETWLASLKDNRVDLTPFTSTNSPTLDDIVSATRHFMQGDTLHQEFYTTRLAAPLKNLMNGSDLSRNDALDQLAPPDRALLVTAGLITE